MKYLFLFPLFYIGLTGNILAADPIPDECGYFNSALSTRTECSENAGGTIEFTGEANIYDNLSTTLATCNVITPQWVLDRTETCESGDCVAEPGNTKSLSISYDNTPSSASTDDSPTNSRDNATINGDITLEDAEYNTIDFNYEGVGKTLTFEQSTSWMSRAQTLKVNNITSAWQILFKDNVDIEIGAITGATYGSPISIKTDNDSIDTISIDSMLYKENTIIDLEATDNINIKTFEVGRGSSDVIFKAPTVTIDSLTVSNSGSGQADITIIADEINIGTLDMGQGANVTILPYTDGQNINFKSNTLKASSSSELILSSGDYYTALFDIPGSSDVSSVRAKDADQIINLYINNDFKPGNNPGINSDGNNGNFGTLPAKNFRMFINGDLNTGGGGTTFNAIIYTEGDASLGNPSYIKGALSANNYIGIGQGSKIYYNGDQSNDAYLMCLTPLPAEDDICYADPYTEQADLLPASVCMGFGGVNCRNIIPIMNISDGNITNIEVVLTSDGIMSGSFRDGCGVKDDLGTCINDSDHTVGGQITIFGYSFIYDLDDMTVEDNQRDTYTESAISINFNNKKLYTTYIKDGQRYYGEVYPCAAGASTTFFSGPFDAWDTDSNITRRIIKTKVVSNDFNLTIASLNSSNDDVEEKEGIDIQYRLYDLNTSTAVTEWTDYNSSSESDGASSTKLFTGIESAYRDVRVQFRFCATPGVTGGIILHSLAYCDNNSSLDVNTTTFSTDNFAIRPYTFSLFGLNQYKHAADDFNITIKATNEGNFSKLGNSSYDGDSISTIVATPLYNTKLDDIEISSKFYQPTASEIDQMQTDTGKTDVATCPSSGTLSINNTTDSFNNGEIIASLKFTETGILDINVSEKAGKEWAKVDADDTPDTQRYIPTSSLMYDESNIAQNMLTFIVPYKLETTSTYVTTTGEEWLYMNDINGSNATLTTPEHAVYITYTIVAKNKDGDITTNFTKTCFPDVDEVNSPRIDGIKLNTTFDLMLDADINSSENASISLYTENNTSSYISTPNKNLALIQGQNHIQEWISPFEFENGKGEARIYLNIDRTASITKNPTTIKVIDTNTSTSLMSNPSPKEFIGNNVNSIKTFYYGRTHVPRQRFINQDGNASMYYEIFCSGSSCNKALLPDGLNSTTSDDPRWFINTQHTAVSGLPGDTNQKTYSVGSGYVIQTQAATGNAPDHVSLHYNGERGYPYKTTMENNASTWLLYNQFDATVTKNEFDVEFSNADSEWAGKRETNTTTNRNASDQTNRRMMW